MTAADRVRLARQRRNQGDVLVRLLIHAEGVADLVALGWAQPGASPAEIRAAMVSMIAAGLEARIAARPVLPAPAYP